MKVMQMTNYLGAAKSLEELMLELIKKEIIIPAHVVGDLKSGRSFAGILLRSSGDANDAEVAAKAAFALQNAEMNLLALAETGIGIDYAESWQHKIIAAYKEEAAKTSDISAPKTLPKVPKGEHWIRIQTLELANFEEHEPDKPPEVFGLTAVEQKDGYTLIYGKKENITSFLGEIRQKLGKVGFNCSNRKK